MTAFGARLSAFDPMREQPKFRGARPNAQSREPRVYTDQI